MANTNGKPRKKDSARLIWDTKPRRAPNPKDIEFQTAEVVIPNPKTAGLHYGIVRLHRDVAGLHQGIAALHRGIVGLH
jgi:hypothetical protein